MRKWFLNISLRWKLVCVTILMTASALILAGLIMAAYDARSYEQEETAAIMVEARVVSSGVSAALAFNDPQAIRDYLKALDANSSISAAAAYDADGTMVAYYARSDLERKGLPTAVGDLGYRMRGGVVQVFEPVTEAGNRLGSVYLKSNIESVAARIGRYGLILFFIAIITFAVAVPMSLKLSGMISTPIERDQQIAQKRFQELQAEYLHVSRLSEIGQMASALAHELNQPLTAISNYMHATQRLLAVHDIAAVETARAVMVKIADQALRAGSVIRRLRDFVTRGDTEKSIESVDELVDEAIALASAAICITGVTIRRELNLTEPSVVVDRIQIQQVLLNLIRNAVEAMEGQLDPQLTLTADVRRDVIELAIRDNGPGLPEEVASRLFEPFVTTKKSGMGVGLSICRTIVEAHGGRLWAEPNLSGGTVFRFTLARPSITSELVHV